MKFDWHKMNKEKRKEGNLPCSVCQYFEVLYTLFEALNIK